MFFMFVMVVLVSLFCMGAFDKWSPALVFKLKIIDWFNNMLDKVKGLF